MLGFRSWPSILSIREIGRVILNFYKKDSAMGCISAFFLFNLFQLVKVFGALIILYFHFYYAKLFRIKHAYSKKKGNMRTVLRNSRWELWLSCKSDICKSYKIHNWGVWRRRCHLGEIILKVVRKRREAAPPAPSWGSCCIALFNGNLSAVLQTM